MTIIAKCSVELNGHIYHKGEKCSYDGDITMRIVDNFTDESGLPLAVLKNDPPEKSASSVDKESANRAAVEKTIAVMGRDGIRRALDAMNVAYSPNAKTEYLAKALLMSRGEIEG